MNTRQRPAASKSEPYEAVLVDDGWKAMTDWEKRREENGWRFSGECPHCHHHMDKFFADHVLVMGLLADAPSGERQKESVVICNCGKPHPGGGDSANGCGAYWGIEVDTGSDPGDRQEG